MSKQSYDHVPTPEDEAIRDRGDLMASILDDCDGDTAEAQRRLDEIDRRTDFVRRGNALTRRILGGSDPADIEEARTELAAMVVSEDCPASVPHFWGACFPSPAGGPANG